MKIIYLFLLVFLLQPFKSQTAYWVSLPQELNNTAIDMVEYQGKLIVCGRFTAAGSIPLKSIAAWDGNQWTGLGRGLRYNSSAGDNGYACKLLVFNNELYAVGSFDSAGAVAAKNIARWNGVTWTGLTMYLNGPINTIAAFNNEIYIGGNFGGIENIGTNYIARYNGSTWQSVGTGTNNGTNGTINDMCLFNNSLYVSGSFWGAGGVSAKGVASWDGSAWHGLANSDLAGTAMIEWNNKLLLANFDNASTNSSEIHQWDWANWSVFSGQDLRATKKFYIFKNKLYCTSGLNFPGPTGDSWVYVWDEFSQSWKKVGTGINHSTFALYAYHDELYCGGRFNVSENANHNYIAKLVTSTSLKTNTVSNLEVAVFPNPVRDKLTLELNYAGALKYSITNALGQAVCPVQFQALSSVAGKSYFEIDISFLQAGIYYLKLESGQGNNLFKIVKE